MAKKEKYRLQVLLVIKERAKCACEIALSKALRVLKEEKEKLEELEEEKKKIKERIAKEQDEMRTKVASGDALIKDPQIHINFIRKLKEDLEKQEQKIADQKLVVQQAEKTVQRCRTDYMIAAQDLNMMEKHKELWQKKLNKELNAQENKLMNELGNTIHQINKMRS